MIKMSAKGLAKFISAGPATQRKILQDFKYPNADEPFAMRMYYREAKSSLRTYITDQQSSEWLREQARALTQPTTNQSPSHLRRIQQNAEAIVQLHRHFGGRQLEILECPRFQLKFAAVSVSAAPDFLLSEGTATWLIKLQFGGPKPDKRIVNVLTQLLLEGANSRGLALRPSSVVYLDVIRNEICTARSGTRTLRDIKAACETISQVWDSIPPPQKSKRSAAA
jgi:hypothetical protein